MGKLTAGMLLVIMGVLTFAPQAGAAEIPPSAECSEKVRPWIRQYEAETDGASKAEEKAADRKLANRLFKAGCITDIEPLLKKVPAKPFTEQCVEGAAAADEYWGAVAPVLRRTIRKWNRRIRPVMNRKQRVINRIKVLRLRDASPKRIQAWVRLRKKLLRKQGRLTRHLTKDLKQLLVPVAYDSYLILIELASLRCFETGGDIDQAKGPAARVLRKRAGMIFIGVIFVTVDRLDRGAGSGASASAAGSDARAGTLPLVDFALPR